MSLLAALADRFANHGNRIRSIERELTNLRKDVGQLLPDSLRKLTAQVDQAMLNHTPIVPFVYIPKVDVSVDPDGEPGFRRLKWSDLLSGTLTDDFSGDVFTLDLLNPKAIKVQSPRYIAWTGCFGFAIPAGVHYISEEEGEQNVYVSIWDDGLGFPALLGSAVNGAAMGIYTWTQLRHWADPWDRKSMADGSRLAVPFGAYDSLINDRNAWASGSRCVWMFPPLSATLDTGGYFHFAAAIDPVYAASVTHPIYVQGATS